MVKDFKASQVRTTQIIASASLLGKPSIIIASASSPGVDYSGSGLTNSALMSGVGADVFMFVSGSKNSRGTATQGATLFGGDVIISGSLSGSNTATFSDVYVKNLYASGTSKLLGSVDVGFATNVSPTTGSLIVRGGPDTQNFFKSGSQTVQLIGTGTNGSGAGIIFGDSSPTYGVGIFEDQDNQLLVKVSGRVNIDAANNVGIKIANPAYGLDVNDTVGVRGTFSALGNVYVNGDLAVTGNTTIAGDLTVNGTTATVNSVNLVVKDPLIYIASGGITKNQNGGFAIASGSNTADVDFTSLVFGRVANDTWGAGKLNVMTGSVTNLTTMQLVSMRASDFQVGGSTAALSSSDGAGLTAIGTYVGIASSNPTFPGNDTYLFVSGAILSKNSSSRGAATFGGDVAISGNVYFDRFLDVGDKRLLAGTPAPPQNVVTGALIVRGGPNNAVFFGSGSQTVHLIGTGANGSGASIVFGDYGNVYGVGISEDQDDTMLIKARSRISLVSQLSGIGINRDDPLAKLHVGGTVIIDDTLYSSGTITARTGISGSLTKLTDGTSFIVAGTNVNIVTGANGAITISSTIPSVSSFFNSVTAATIYTTGSAAFVNSEIGITKPADKGSDVCFYVSGSSGTKNSSTSGVALFGGDMSVSGNVYFDRSLDIGNKSLLAGTPSPPENVVTGSLVVRGGPNVATFFGAGSQTMHLIGTGANGSGAGVIFGDHGAVYGVGIFEDQDDTMLLKARSRINLFSQLSGVGINKSSPVSKLHVGGDAIIDTTLYVTGVVTAAGVSGSLTKLIDGTSFLIAGSGATITTGANGAVTIATTGGTPGGSSGQIQFNSAGVFGGNSSLTFNAGTNTFTTVNSSVTSLTGTSIIAPAATDMNVGVDNTQKINIGPVAGAAGPAGADVYLSVSGAINSAGTANRGVAVFGGDMVVSGNVYGAGGSFGTSTFNIIGTKVVFKRTATESTIGGSDTRLAVSGSIGTRGINGGGVSVFGGDTVTSGTVYFLTSSVHTGDVQVSKTITPAGTTGAQTINKTAGRVNFAASATSLVVTNSFVTVNSVILCTVASVDATFRISNVVASAGSFTINAVAPTGETAVNFLVIN